MTREGTTTVCVFERPKMLPHVPYPLLFVYFVRMKETHSKGIRLVDRVVYIFFISKAQPRTNEIFAANNGCKIALVCGINS